MAVRKSVFSRLVLSKFAPDRSQLLNVDWLKSLSVKSASRNTVLLKVVFLSLQRKNEAWLSVQLCVEIEKPKGLQLANCSPSILQPSKWMPRKAVFSKFAIDRLQCKNLQSMKKIPDMSAVDKSQLMNWQFSYSPFGKADDE